MVSSFMGQLLYDESLLEERKKKVQLYKRRGLGSIVIAICGWLLLIMLLYPELFSMPHQKPNIVVLICAFVAIILGTLAFLVMLAIDDLKIYENGIVHPWKKFLHRESNFIPFSEIKEIYLNPRLPLITILRKNEPPVVIDKDDIVDFIKVVDILRTKVKIIERENLNLWEARRQYKMMTKIRNTTNSMK